MCCLLLLHAAPAAAQVEIDAHLDKVQYLAGEPIVIVVDVRNTGGEAVAYSESYGDVSFSVVGASRRVPPNIFGCYSGQSSRSTIGFGSHPPLLAPGETTSFKYLLKEYDLVAGQYSLAVSGRAGVQRKDSGTEPVPGAQFQRTLSLNVVAASDDELRRAFAPRVSDADGSDPTRRYAARAAIIESAPRFLDTLIARFAAEDQYGIAAIEALGRLATTESRAQLRNLFASSRDSRRSATVVALARVGHRDDTEFLAGVLHDPDVDTGSRGYAALGLGHIGGERAVQDLERALPTAPSDVRSSIATALGNTRSRTAVPVLIGMFGNNPAQDAVCSSLRTLTHRAWCDNSGGDPAAYRRRWLRWWNENGSSAPVFGQDECPAEPAVAPYVAATPPVVAHPRKPRVPRVTSLKPEAAAPNSVIEISGYELYQEDWNSQRVLFTQNNVEQVARRLGSRGSTDPRVLQAVEVAVPEAVTAGTWLLVVENNGRRSAPVTVSIIEVSDPVIVGISPARPHPAQLVRLSTERPAQLHSSVELVDASHAQWRIETAISSRGITFALPDEVAEGEAIVRLSRAQNGVERFSAPLTFFVTSDPFPLNPRAVARMMPVASGQWTDVIDYDDTDFDIGFELGRADRIEVEFRQGNVAVINQTTGHDRLHVQVPMGLAPGKVSVRTRTWIEQTASEWSAPVRFRVLARPVAPSIAWIDLGPTRDLAWWPGTNTPAFVPVKPGDSLVLHGLFPVARAVDLRIQVKGTRATYELSPTEVTGGVEVVMPAQASPGDWRLVIGTREGLTPLKEVATLRVR